MTIEQCFFARLCCYFFPVFQTQPTPISVTRVSVSDPNHFGKVTTRILVAINGNKFQVTNTVSFQSPVSSRQTHLLTNLLENESHTAFLGLGEYFEAFPFWTAVLDIPSSHEDAASYQGMEICERIWQFEIRSMGPENRACDRSYVRLRRWCSCGLESWNSRLSSVDGILCYRKNTRND